MLSAVPMTDQDLQQLRREKWRLDGKPVRTIEEARAFVEAVGFCLMYPVRPTVPVPTFIGAFVGSDNRLPTWHPSYCDARERTIRPTKVRSGTCSAAGRPMPSARALDCRCSRHSRRCSRNTWTAWSPLIRLNWKASSVTSWRALG